MASKLRLRGSDILCRDTRGSTSMEVVALLGVAALGIAGFSSFGGAMGDAISGEAPGGQSPTSMALSQQAGALNGAGRLAKEVAKALEGLSPEEVADLARRGADIARKEHSLGRTPISAIADNMRASEFLALDDWLWESVGKKGGLTKEQALYWLGADAPKQASAPLNRDVTALIADQGAKLAVVDDAPWLRFDGADNSPARDIQLKLLRDSLNAKPFLADGIARHSLALGFFDFRKADPALGSLMQTRVRRGLFFNVADGQPFDMNAVIRTVGDVVKEFDGADITASARKGAQAFPSQHRVAPLADENLRSALEAVMPTNPRKSVQGWGYNSTKSDGALDVMQDRALRHMASLHPAYELLEDGSVPKFLAANGFGDQALRLRETGTLLRVDAVDFTSLNTALHHRGETVRASQQAAYYDVTTKHLLVNLAHEDLADLPRLIADFVDLVVPPRP